MGMLGEQIEGYRKKEEQRKACESFTTAVGVFFFFNLFVYLLYLFWLRWVFVAARGLSLVAASGGCSSLQIAGFSLRWPLLLWSMSSRPAGFSSCCMQPQ